MWNPVYGHVDSEDTNNGIVEGEWRLPNDALKPLQPTCDGKPTTEDMKIQDDMAKYFANRGGRIPWQDAGIS